MLSDRPFRRQRRKSPKGRAGKDIWRNIRKKIWIKTGCFVYESNGNVSVKTFGILSIAWLTKAGKGRTVPIICRNAAKILLLNFIGEHMKETYPKTQERDQIFIWKRNSMPKREQFYAFFRVMKMPTTATIRTIGANLIYRYSNTWKAAPKTAVSGSL